MIDPLIATGRVAASGLESQSNRLRVISENLANANSTGNTPGADAYRRKIISFEAALDEASGTEIVQVAGVDESEAPQRSEYDPHHPAADAQGYVKMPNVNVLIELADMREASRAYEANLQVITQARELVSMTIDLLRT